MGEHTHYPTIMLSERQWDVVRDALIQRGTKEARTIAEKIWRQGGGTHNEGDPHG